MRVGVEPAAMSQVEASICAAMPDSLPAGNEYLDTEASNKHQDDSIKKDMRMSMRICLQPMVAFSALPYSTPSRPRYCSTSSSNFS